MKRKCETGNPGFAVYDPIGYDTDEELECDEPEVAGAQTPKRKDSRDKLSEFEELLKSPDSEFSPTK